jgi:hypothetical protein
VSIRIWTREHTYESHLFDALNERSEFRAVFEVTQPGVIRLDFHCEVKHRDLVNGVVVFGSRGRYRTALTEAGLGNAPLTEIKGAVGGGNILNITDHYGRASFIAALASVPGWYRFEVWMYSNSSISHANGHCCAISNQQNPASQFGSYNNFMITEFPGAVLNP